MHECVRKILCLISNHYVLCSIGQICAQEFSWVFHELMIVTVTLSWSVLCHRGDN
jgi:hypothetical protein